MVKESEYTEGGEVYRETFDEEDKKEDSERNVVKVAGRPMEVYIMTIMTKLQTNDQIEIQCFDTYADRAIRIIEILDAIGIRPEGGKIRFVKTPEDIINRKTGKKFRQLVNRITLSKIPELYRFTRS